MPWSDYKPSKRAVFAGLMVLSALALALPRDWSDALKNAGQLLVAPMDWLYRLSHGAAASVSRLNPAFNHDAKEQQVLLHQLASQVATTEQLREENARLRALRDGGLSVSLPLLPAKVVARDVVAWRDSVLIERGSTRGVGRRDWVASRFFVDQGRAAGLEEGQVVLAGECLLGHVEQVSPYMSRVQLLSDIDGPRTEVRVGARRGQSFEFVDYPCSLRGHGRGRMIIEDVPYQYVEATAIREPGPDQRRIRVGDLVFTSPGQLGLAVPLVVGEVIELVENPKKRLVVSLLVRPPVPIDRIREVFIIPLVPIDRMPLPE
jgi:cell shape-determining protein MreC